MTMIAQSLLRCGTRLLAAGLVLGAGGVALAQPKDVNYDEAKIAPYTLPDPLVTEQGTKITDSKSWEKRRRPELLRQFETQMYGRCPARPNDMRYEVTSLDTNALDGLATRKEVSIYLAGKRDGPRLDLLLFVPNGTNGPVPAFLGLNFEGNQTVSPDPGIKITEHWMRNKSDGSVTNNVATEATRGAESNRWPVAKIVGRGYALVTAYYGDLEPDFTNGWKLGIRAALGRDGAETKFRPDQWGGIAAWAWGLSRAQDYLVKDKSIDASRVAVMGHSRLGKTSLWAGAADERFAIVISNDSGEGGAALARRNIGETTAILNKNFPHWFCGNFKQYSGHETDLPFDMHELIALMAPRPVYVASAEDDKWADPKGEFLAAKNAEPVYRLYGKAGLGVDEMPAVNKSVGDFIGYHVRTGKHDVTDFDWDQYLNFADRHFKKAPEAKK